MTNLPERLKIFIELLINEQEVKLLKYKCKAAQPINKMKPTIILNKNYMPSFNKIIEMIGTEDEYIIEKWKDKYEALNK